MKLYRFSPIKTEVQLREALAHVHAECSKLCNEKIGGYLPVAGNIGIFCHYDDEFDELIKLRNQLVDINDNWNQKYYRLHKPLTIPEKDGVPAATYTHLYVRRPDPYRSQVGDADFVMPVDQFKPLKQSLLAGEKKEGVRAFDRPELDMIELHDPDIDALSYVHTHTMEDNMRRQKDE